MPSAPTWPSTARSPRCTQVSHDPSLQHLLTLKDGRTMTAVELQVEYLELARKYVEDRYGADADDADRATCCTAGSRCSTGSSATRCSAAGELDWVAKLALLESLPRPRRPRLGRPQAAPVDLQYADLRPDKGLYHRLVARGSMRAAARPTTRSQRAMTEPPRTPGPTSAAAASRSTPTGSRPRPGTRSSSTCPAATRCSGSRPWSRSRGTKAARRRAARPLRHRRGAVRRHHRAERSRSTAASSMPVAAGVGPDR